MAEAYNNYIEKNKKTAQSQNIKVVFNIKKL
jgi:hypothetical protein